MSDLTFMLFKVYSNVESDLCIDSLNMCLFKISKANDFLLLPSLPSTNLQNLNLYVSANVHFRLTISNTSLKD